MPNVRPLTRGDRRRNEKLSRLRAIVRPDLAIVGIDLASAKQAVVVADHDSIILGRRMFDGDPWVIDQILDWALPIAIEAGFAGVVVGRRRPARTNPAALTRSTAGADTARYRDATTGSVVPINTADNVLP